MSGLPHEARAGHVRHEEGGVRLHRRGAPQAVFGNVRLRNALVLAYGEKLVLERLDDLHVPKGMIDLAFVETTVEIPSDCVAYTVTFPADSVCELARMYGDFFTRPVH